MKQITVSVLTPFLEKTGYIKSNKRLLEDDPRVIEFLTLKGISPISKARQQLLKRSKGEYVLWIDSDIELKNNPLNQMSDSFTSDTAGVCATTVELDQTYKLDLTIRKCFSKIYHKKRSHLNCGLFKRKCLLNIDGFDTKLIAAEDNDLQIRLNKAGYKVLGLRDVEVLHHSSRSFEKEKWYFEGYKAIFNKHGFFENENKQINLFSNKFRFEKFKSAPLNFISEILKNQLIKTQKRINLIPEIWRNLLAGINPELVKPKECGLLITENCLFRCRSCTYWKQKANDLTKEELFKIIDQLSAFGIKIITLVGGEPLLREDLNEIIDYIKFKNIRCGIITNGFLWKEKLVELLKLDFINVSIDGLEKIHDTLRNKKGAWNRAVDLLFELKKKYNKETSVSFVLQEKNYKEFKPLYEFLSNLLIPIYILCYNSGGMGQPTQKQNNSLAIQYLLDNNLSYLRDEQKEYLKLVLKKCNNPAFGSCLSSNIKFMIASNGDLFPCSAWNKPVGNLIQESLEKVWKGYSSLRKRIRLGQEPSCNFCVSCELTNNFVKGSIFNRNLANRAVRKLI